MLDNETKRRIDTARDILVGKVPDPKSQVEQITIALIYKFMDDMDKESIDFGGKATFFTGEYEKYGWSKIFDPRLGGYEMLALYGEAIEKLDQNPNIPQLFRDIFKNAYLPYRDPETLKLFLKTINEFTYEHSEKLGDAYEYLLSVLGSQGDAGQFRTPRHIIDFIVNIMQPKKNETILDPACGTAGFLISSYKYILKTNAGNDLRKSAESSNELQSAVQILTPAERKKLMEHFTGYDISPDMVRMSLVNMYLHNFTSPKVYEYDTLTSEDRWGDYFDIIMANPPFMSPKGGIKPHKKFSMQANRSEVLFVDYIMEHINPTTGRAGVIVPEGIMFKSEAAFKALRKLLLDKNYLYAVVSLPAGVFNPYSGVKTSVLLMDKTIARKTDKILFAKIENDGFDLGAQRKPIDKTDLPKALEIINKYKDAVLNNESFDCSDANVLLVEKEKIKANTDYNLSVDRYRINGNARQVKYEMVKLGDVLDYEQPAQYIVESENYNDSYKTPVLTAGKTFILGYTNEVNGIYSENLPVIIFDDFTTATKLVDFPFKVKSSAMKILKAKKEVANIKFLYYTMQKIDFNSSDHKRYWISQYSQIKIPLPPLSIQQEIVNKIEGWQKIIDGAKQVIENYKPQIDIDPEWEMVKLGEVCEVNPKKSELKDLPLSTIVSFVPMSDINENQIDFESKEERLLEEVYSGYTYFKNDEVLLAKVTPCFENGKAGIAKNLNNGIGFGSSEFYVFRCTDRVLPVWIYLNITSERFRKLGEEQMTGTGGLQRVPKDFLLNYEITVPSISVQHEIVNQIAQERQWINSNKELKKIFEQKIKHEINKLWI